MFQADAEPDLEPLLRDARVFQVLLSARIQVILLLNPPLLFFKSLIKPFIFSSENKGLAFLLSAHQDFLQTVVLYQ